MPSIIQPILKEVCTVGLADQLIDLIKGCAKCHTVQGIVGIAGIASAAPLLLPAAALVGMELFKRKGDRDHKKEFQEHCTQVIGLLRGMDGQIDFVADQIDAMIQHRAWVWARFSGADQANFAQRIRGEIVKDLTNLHIDIRDGLQGLVIYSETILATLDNHSSVLTELRDTQRHQPTTEDIDQLRQEMRLIRDALANKPAPSDPDEPPPVPEPVVEAARAIQQNPEASLLERTEAAIVSRSPTALDQLAKLDALVETADYKRHQLRGDYHYYRGEFDKAIQPFEKAMALRPNDMTARNNTALAHCLARLGNIAGHRKRAIEIFEGTLRLVRPRSADWAGAQNNLGVAWRSLPTGDRASNIRAAIDCHTRALEVCTKTDFPADWAMRQNNLGNAWSDLPTGDRASNIRAAIECYTRALEVYTKTDFPAEWAMTQNNLGTTWFDLPTGDLASNIRAAIECYTRALEVYTKTDFPAEWAITQNNLGNAWRNLPTGDRASNIRAAIESYTRALEVRTKTDFPVQWAMTQNNLGNAWSDLPSGDLASNIRAAIECYTQALEVYTKIDFPADWATTQNNLGAAWRKLPTGERASNIRTAIECYTRALQVYTKTDFPADWAMTQYNLAIALADLADQPNLPPAQSYCNLLRQAIACSKAALTVRTSDAFPHDHAATMHNMNIDRRAYEAAGCAEQMPFDKIAPAE
jgi:tetratricopeptide (TPR) repeat protein